MSHILLFLISENENTEIPPRIRTVDRSGKSNNDLKNMKEKMFLKMLGVLQYNVTPEKGTQHAKSGWQILTRKKKEKCYYISSSCLLNYCIFVEFFMSHCELSSSDVQFSQQTIILLYNYLKTAACRC